MSIEDLKDLLFKISQGRRDSAEQLAELLHPLLFPAVPEEEPAKPKKAAK
jgi:hypothetical protein